MLKNIIYTALLPLFSLAAIHAAEPVLDRHHKINTTSWSWRINSADMHTLNLYKGHSTIPAVNFDLDGCMFCTGEDDGCEQDGIFDITLKQDLNEPILVAVCHIGAHSRLLQIFAPQRDKQNAVHTVTGDFIIDYEIDAQGITVKYDRRNDKGEFVQKLSRWPHLLDMMDK